MKNLTFRIGICECSNIFAGKFTGVRIQVWNRLVSLEEIAISPKHSEAELRRSGCHFFLDYHLYSGGWHEVHIERMPVPIGSWNSETCLIPWTELEKCSKKGPVSVRTVKGWIKELTKYIPPNERELFLERRIVRGA